MNPSTIKVILIRPRNPDNIGAAARAMANFGLTELALVGAFDSDWGEAAGSWRREASVSAIDSMEIIDSARLYTDIPSAAKDCAALFGTASLHRLKPDRDVAALRDAHPLFAACGGKVGLLFGPEKTGLTKQDLSYCSAILNIPTLPRQPSMNLGQAVAVAAYELSGRREAAPLGAREPAPALPPAELERLTRRILEKLRAKGGPHWEGEAQERAIRRGLIDARLNKDAMNALKLFLED